MKTKANKPAKSNIAKMAIVGVLSAIAYLLMFMEFSVPLMPVFIKMDLSDFPALIGSLAVGPAGGIIIALIKNLLHLTVTSTGGVGELSMQYLSCRQDYYIRKRNQKRVPVEGQSWVPF